MAQYTTRGGVEVRTDWMHPFDLEGAAACGTGWREADFQRCLKEKNCIGFVTREGHWESARKDDGSPGPACVWDEGPVVGCMVYALHKRHVEVLCVGVRPSHRRLGVGETLLTYLTGCKVGSGMRYTHAEATVPETLLAAHLFFRACGWRAEGVVREAWAGQDGYRFVSHAVKGVRA